MAMHGAMLVNVVFTALTLLFHEAAAAVPAPDWPSIRASKKLLVRKTFGMDSDTEPTWLHLHQSTSPVVGLTVLCYNGWEDPCSGAGPRLRYTVQGLPVTPWLAWGARDTSLSITHPLLSYLGDGVLDISVEVAPSTPDRLDYKPWPVFLHLKRGLPLGSLRAVVFQDGLGGMVDESAYWPPGAQRIAITERRMPGAGGFVGSPANPSLTRWSTPPYATDLYMEHLTPGGGLFQEQPMWWEDLPNHAGLFFVRGLQPKDGEDVRFVDNHPKFPAADGARGIGWTSPYIQGLVDSAGRFAFAETSGRVGWLLPTGEIYTLAGWTLMRGRSPVWVRKPLSVIRTNQQLRGTGAAFQAGGGFGRPMDVAFDRSTPAGSTVMYVPDLTKHVIWRLQLIGLNQADQKSRPAVQVDVLAGDGTTFSPGYVDGSATTARFHSPYSAVFARGALYVSDSENHAIRRINVTTGAVTTVWGGGPTFAATLQSRGVGDPENDQTATRAAMRVAVTAGQAATGLRPEIFWPAALRARSDGSLILVEHGVGQMRRLDPDTHVASVLADLDPKFGEWDHGWVWLDVDITGATGPVDGVWWCKAVGEEIQGDSGYHFNELFVWTPPEGGGSRFVFTGRGGGADPFNWGARTTVTPPHYPWLVAVDPRGGVLLTGMGVHGVARVRLRQAGDPVVEGDDANWDYYRGREWFAAGTIANGGPLVRPLGLRFGAGAHSTLGLRSGDAWQTQGMTDNQLLKFYGLADLMRINDTAGTDEDRERKRCILAFLRPQAGPTRDGLPRAAQDVSAPSRPGRPVATPLAEGVVLKWFLSSDNVAVSGYFLQVAYSTTFAAASAVPKHFNVFIGQTDVLLLEGLRAGLRHYARVQAVDLAGNTSPWSAYIDFVPR